MPESLQQKSLPGFATKWKSSYERIGRLPAAYLFAGPSGSGKKATAGFIATTLLGENKNHPDLIRIVPEKSIKIEVIREVIRRLSLRPVAGDRLVVVIEDADFMTEGSANALLKTLEEPPSYVLFLLLTTAPEKLPSTIRSRCQRINFSVNLSSFRERHARLLEDWKDSLCPVFEENRPSFSKSSRIAEAIAKGSDDIKSLFELLQVLWHDVSVWKETREETNIILPQSLSWITSLADKKTSDQIFEELDCIAETERAIEGNVNKTIALERLFVKLQGCR